MLEGETILYGDALIPGVVIHDDGDRLQVKFFGPDILGVQWVETEKVQLALAAEPD
jgi:hypothetical protein